MDLTDPTTRRADMDPDTLSGVAALVRAAARLANTAAGATSTYPGSTSSPRRSPPPAT